MQLTKCDRSHSKTHLLHTLTLYVAIRIKPHTILPLPYFCSFFLVLHVHIVNFCFFSTVTGNTNFKMNQTSFTLVGFTRPQAALPIIDLQKNAKGFTSRLLWWFPTPVFCILRDTMLQETETEKVKTFSQQLGNFNFN